MSNVVGKESKVKEWQLVLKGSIKSIDDFSNKLAEDLDSDSSIISTTAEIIMQNLASEFTNPRKEISGLSYFNMNTPWNDKVQEYFISLIVFAREKLNLKVSFATLGLDLDDYFFDLEETMPIEFVSYLKEYQF